MQVRVQDLATVVFAHQLAVSAAVLARLSLSIVRPRLLPRGVAFAVVVLSQGHHAHGQLLVEIQLTLLDSLCTLLSAAVVVGHLMLLRQWPLVGP